MKRPMKWFGSLTSPRRVAALGLLATGLAHPAVGQATVEAGQDLYGLQCSACHGADLLHAPGHPGPNLKASATLNSYESFSGIVRDGVTGGVISMPAFSAAAVDDDTLCGVYLYIRAVAGRDIAGASASACGAAPPNTPPQITSNGGGAHADIAVREGLAEVTRVAAIDAETANPAYAIVGGPDAHLFTMDGASGALRFRSPPAFDAPGDQGRNNVYDLIVEARDEGELADQQTLAVAVEAAPPPAEDLGDAPPLASSFEFVPDESHPVYLCRGGGRASLSMAVASPGTANQRWRTRLSFDMDRRDTEARPPAGACRATRGSNAALERAVGNDPRIAFSFAMQLEWSPFEEIMFWHGNGRVQFDARHANSVFAPFFEAVQDADRLFYVTAVPYGPKENIIADVDLVPADDG